VGQQVTAEFARTAAGAPLPGAVGLVLANPIDVQITPHDPLPHGTGSGLSAFYYSLLVYLGVATWLGMPIPREWPLFGYGVFAIVAVGVTATSMIAALGSMGLLVNLLVFVILGLPSAGATVPLEATPTFFLWLAHFEPMHQVYLGTRALLYFNGHADAGLSRALTMCGIGLAVGLALGVVVTRIYDRKGYHRIGGGEGGEERKNKAEEEKPTTRATTTLRPPLPPRQAKLKRQKSIRPVPNRNCAVTQVDIVITVAIVVKSVTSVERVTCKVPQHRYSV
jgi:hypothetical protein